MKAPQSRLLARLDGALARTRHPVEAACLRAERAGFLARLGHLDAARATVQALHAQFDTQPHAAVSSWLCLVEGWLLQAEAGGGAGARDRFKRAQALSAAAGLAPLQALSAAWLAHLAYLADDVDDMVRHVSLALGLAAPHQHDARARACMVVALGYDFAECPDRAQPWYLRAREHANADGDETTLSALNHNIASHRAHHAMQAALFGSGADVHGQARQALAGTEATGNFDDLVGARSPDAVLPLQRAGLASLQGRHAEALSLYERHLEDGCRQGLARLAAPCLADAAGCRWQLGDRAGAARDAQAAAARLAAVTMQADDRAMTHARLATLFKLLEDADAHARHAASARDDWAAHRRLQARWLEALDTATLQPA